jgi:hypothetical protein
MVCTFLVGCFTALALGQQNVERPSLTPTIMGQDVDHQNEDPLVARRRLWDKWFARQSEDLLDIIKILYKGREADLKELEAVQAKMKSEDQIERRIALIKATLSEKEAK